MARPKKVYPHDCSVKGCGRPARYYVETIRSPLPGQPAISPDEKARQGELPAGVYCSQHSRELELRAKRTATPLEVERLPKPPRSAG